MSLLKFLKRRNNSTASIAKERLQIIISHERRQHNAPDFLPQLQTEIIEVIAKYLPIDRDQVKVNLDRMGENAVLELNVTMPDEAIAE